MYTDSRQNCIYLQNIMYPVFLIRSAGINESFCNWLAVIVLQIFMWSPLKLCVCVLFFSQSACSKEAVWLIREHAASVRHAVLTSASILEWIQKWFLVSTWLEILPKYTHSSVYIEPFLWLYSLVLIIISLCVHVCVCVCVCAFIILFFFCVFFCATH
jgi:hypothetical protein